MNTVKFEAWKEKIKSPSLAGSFDVKSEIPHWLHGSCSLSNTGAEEQQVVLSWCVCTGCVQAGCRVKGSYILAVLRAQNTTMKVMCTRQESTLEACK